MLIAHGPIGYLLAKASARWWQFEVHPQRLISRWYIIAFIGGIFPDIDLFFYYFIDASLSHRQLLTHSFIPYLLLLGLAIGLWWLRPTLRTWAIGLGMFAMGALSHVLADGIAGSVIAFAPISNNLYGLVSLAWYRDSIFGRYQLVTNFTAEFLLILLAGYYYFTGLARRRFLYSTGALTLTGLIAIVFINQHVYAPNGTWYYSDPDQDGILTAQDRDSDGDHILNIIDADIDNDGDDNSVDMYLETFSMVGSLYDYSEGVVVEIPIRLGMVNTTVLITRSFANVGIFFTEEMQADYAEVPTGYVGQPTDSGFSSNVTNWQVWLEHLGRLLPATTQRNEFDIVFFESGHVGFLVRDTAGNDYVLESDASHPFTRNEPLDQVIEREGDITALGRLLPKPTNKQY